MVLRCEPLIDAIETVKKPNSKVILMCPQGEKFSQKKAFELKKKNTLS